MKFIYSLILIIASSLLLSSVGLASPTDKDSFSTVEKCFTVELDIPVNDFIAPNEITVSHRHFKSTGSNQSEDTALTQLDMIASRSLLSIKRMYRFRERYPIANSHYKPKPKHYHKDLHSRLLRCRQLVV